MQEVGVARKAGAVGFNPSRPRRASAKRDRHHRPRPENPSHHSGRPPRDGAHLLPEKFQPALQLERAGGFFIVTQSSHRSVPARLPTTRPWQVSETKPRPPAALAHNLCPALPRPRAAGASAGRDKRLPFPEDQLRQRGRGAGWKRSRDEPGPQFRHGAPVPGWLGRAPRGGQIGRQVLGMQFIQVGEKSRRRKPAPRRACRNAGSSEQRASVSTVPNDSSRAAARQRREQWRIESIIAGAVAPRD